MKIELGLYASIESSVVKNEKIKVNRLSFKFDAKMKSSIFGLLFIVVVSDFCTADEEYLKVQCNPLAHNYIYATITRPTAEAAVAVYENSGQVAFKSHMKDLMKNIQLKDDTCVLGWVGEWDYNTAVSMYVSGYSDFSQKTKSMKAGNHRFISLKTQRSKEYNANVFTVHSDESMY